MKNSDKEAQYWDNFYKSGGVDIPSQFCVLLATEVSADIPILEIGCGNGRDSLFLARHGYNVASVDLSETAIAACVEKAQNLSNVKFYVGDVSRKDDVGMPLEELRNTVDVNSLVVYSRFFLHSIDDSQQAVLLKTLSHSLKEGDKLYLEFRSVEDEHISKIYDGHYRRYVDTSILQALLEDAGFEITYQHKGKGMAKYKNEDPFVARIIATHK